jgi:hypothetical protein
LNFLCQQGSHQSTKYHQISIFVFLNLLNQFLIIFRVLRHRVIFFYNIFLIFLYSIFFKRKKIVNWGITKKWVMTTSKVTRVTTIETIHIISFLTIAFLMLALMSTTTCFYSSLAIFETLSLILFIFRVIICSTYLSFRYKSLVYRLLSVKSIFFKLVYKTLFILFFFNSFFNYVPNNSYTSLKDSWTPL